MHVINNNTSSASSKIEVLSKREKGKKNDNITNLNYRHYCRQWMTGEINPKRK